MMLRTNVYQLSGRGAGVWNANVFLIAGSHLTLVDTGFRGMSPRILRQVKRLGFSPYDVADIVITHHHADHVGSLATLKKITRARVLAHPADAPYIDGRLPQPGPARPRWLGKILAPFHRVWGTTPVAVDVPVDDGDELPILGGARVLHTPGHTPGSVCLFLHQERLIIVGDLLANRFRLSLPSKEFTVDMAEEIRSIKKVAGLDFDVVCFGHGSPLVRNARSTVINLAEKLESRYQRVLRSSGQT